MWTLRRHEVAPLLAQGDARANPLDGVRHQISDMSTAYLGNVLLHLQNGRGRRSPRDPPANLDAVLSRLRSLWLCLNTPPGVVTKSPRCLKQRRQA